MEPLGGRKEPRTSFRLAREVFLRSLAAVYAAAFASFAVQAAGLVGRRGILPAAGWLDAVHRQLGARGSWEVQTLFWLDASNHALVGATWLGVGLAVLLLVGLAPRWITAGLWVLYASVVHVGQVFFGYQWDALLLEAGLLAVWLAPGGLRPATVRARRTRPAGAAPLFLLRWLLFRLFFLSGVVKLASNDPTWRGLTALRFHYWTQPLPNPLSPFAFFLPARIHTLETAATLAVELLLPLTIFGPRRVRLIGATGLAALQLAINATGNYGFFGPLTLTLCVLLVDDAIWLRVPGLRALLPPGAAAEHRGPGWHRALAAAAVALAVAVTGAHALLRVEPGAPLPEALVGLTRAVEPLDAFHSYGLFAVMTTDRPEIQIEGSRDGKTWLPYPFRWQPDRLDRPPRFATPHMPRLDWQLWFAALDGSCDADPWFLAFERRLLQADPDVLDLLAGDPFHGERPRFVRALLWRYRFADAATRRRTGDWWTRESLGTYCPALELHDGGLRRAAP